MQIWPPYSTAQIFSATEIWVFLLFFPLFFKNFRFKKIFKKLNFSNYSYSLRVFLFKHLICSFQDLIILVFFSTFFHLSCFFFVENLFDVSNLNC